MITVEKFKNIAEAFVVKLGFKGCKVPATEEQTMNLLKDHSGSWLVAVLPTLASGGSNPDAPTKVNQTIFYIIEKEKDGTSHQKQLEQYQRLQKLCADILADLLGENEEDCKTFPNIVVNSIFVDPQYNIFGGWLGWRIIFDF